MRTTNKKSGEYVRDRKPFKASNLSGQWNGELYIVWSYDWYPIWVYDSIGRQWFRNRDRFSQSTTRQQNQTHPGVYVTELSREQMEDMASRRYESVLNIA